MSINEEGDSDANHLAQDIKLACEGCKQAQGRLYETYWPLLTSWSRSYIVNGYLSQRDMVQEAWIRIANGLPGFKAVKNEISDEKIVFAFCAWLRTTARNTFYNLANRSQTSGKPIDSTIETPDPGPSSIARTDEQKEIIRQFVDRLPSPDREIIELSFWDQQSLRSISSFLAMEPTFVRRTYHRVLRELERKL